MNNDDWGCFIILVVFAVLGIVAITAMIYTSLSQSNFELAVRVCYEGVEVLSESKLIECLKEAGVV